MKFKLLIIGIFLLLITPVILAEPDYFFKFGEDANFVASCDVNGVPCDPALAACNLTIRYPNGTYLVDFQPMTIRTNGDVNYTISSNNLIEVGKEYLGKVNCIQSGENKTATFVMMITPTGDNQNVPTVFLILGIASIITLTFGMWLENEYIGFVSGALFIITGIYSMIYGIGNLTDLYTRTIGFSCIGLGFIFEMAAGYKVVEGLIGENRAF